MRLSDKKLEEIKTLPNNAFWPLIKQQLDVAQMCYIVYALQKWQDSDRLGSFESYFDQHKTKPEFGSLNDRTNYRMLSNAAQFGLVYPYKKVEDAIVTPAFKLIDKVCKSKFSDKLTYQHLIDSQLEKNFVNTNSYHIHTVMFLIKVLLTIGDITGEYSITVNELKLFVVNSQKWSDYLKVVQSIIRYREDDTYKAECDHQIDKFADSRHKNLFSNLSYIDSVDNRISLVDEAIKSLRLKIANFENLSTQEIDRRMHDDYMAEPQEGAIRYSDLQKIVYGAPGSGKSRKVKMETEGLPQTRVTFHPDTDYNAFVGSYKPIQDGDAIRYRFVPQQFAKAYVKAWKQYISKPNVPYYLIIEEINRGNCAQIFGDLFQLLDRNLSGFSEYPIDIDADFADYIFSQLSEDERKSYNSHFSAEVVEKNGKCNQIMLPPCFHIMATMNTSDQSLFPMDSAFKRRWEWIYIPIDHTDASKITIMIDESHQYNWGEFIVAVNERIFSATGSPDKQLGNRFVQVGEDLSIPAPQFIGKVLFYLWEEVFKDNKKHSIFNKDTDFFKIYDDPQSVCDIIERLGVTNIVSKVDTDSINETNDSN